jgi:hypothetical protein
MLLQTLIPSRRHVNLLSAKLNMLRLKRFPWGNNDGIVSMLHQHKAETRKNDVAQDLFLG